jgi:hypothetical protein
MASERRKAVPVFRGIVDVEFYRIVVGARCEYLRWWRQHVRTETAS